MSHSPRDNGPQYKPDGDLVRAAQQGDRDAFDRLADLYRAGVMAVVFDLARRLDVAEDLTQDALCRAWESIAGLRDPEKFGPWLRRIAVNCYHMWRRLRRPDLELPEASRVRADQDTFADVCRRDLERELSAGLRAIPRQNRIALLMRYFGRASYQDIANFLDVPKTTVEGRIYRAKLQLRSRLANLVDEEEMN